MLVLAGVAGFGAVVAVVVSGLQTHLAPARAIALRAGHGLATEGGPEPPAGRREALEAPAVERGEPQTADLRALLGGDAGARHALAEQRARQGVVDSPGTEPGAARLEVDRMGWAERQEAELLSGLEELLGEGTRLERLECLEGRCLVELSYDSMSRARDKASQVREWLEARVRCPAHTDGPEEAESPSVPITQQVWILCGPPGRAASR